MPIGKWFNMKKCNIWVYYLLPIVIHLLFLPFWLLDVDISIIEILVGTFIVPVYLIAVFGIKMSRFSPGKFILMLIIILAITNLGIAIDYFNWGIVTGYLLKPDSETVYLTKLQMNIASIIVIIGWIIMSIIKRKKAE